MIPLPGCGSKPPALQLHWGSGRILHIASHTGDHHHPHLLVDVDGCYLVRQVVLSGGGSGRSRVKLNTHPYELSPFLAESQLSKIGSKKRDPDQTPLRPRLLQSGNDLGHSPPEPIVARSRPFSLLLVARRAMGHSLENHALAAGTVPGLTSVRVTLYPGFRKACASF